MIINEENAAETTREISLANLHTPDRQRDQLKFLFHLARGTSSGNNKQKGNIRSPRDTRTHIKRKSRGSSSYKAYTCFSHQNVQKSNEKITY